MDKKLGMLAERTTVVADTVDNVVGGISVVLWELEAIGRYVRETVRMHAASNIAHVQSTRAGVGTSIPAGGQQFKTQSNEGVLKPDGGSPSCPKRELDPCAEEPVGDSPTPTNVVDLDNMPSGSGDIPPTNNARDCIVNSPSTRVQTQSRLRVVACKKTVLSAGATVAATHDKAVHASKYKDPPGYDDVEDFGHSKEPSYRPPILKPRRNGVSRSGARTLHKNMQSPNVFFLGSLNTCADN